MTKPTASLSLDLDNKWAYLRAHDDSAWQARPSYLPRVVERIDGFFADHGLRATVFVVGEDLARSEDRDAVARLAYSGHEIGNHSQNHYPWLADLPRDEVEGQVARAEEAIAALTGTPPVGFRAPGFSWSDTLLEVLAERGYRYDASVFPTVIGPLAGLYSKLLLRRGKQPADEDRPPQRFASLADAFRPLRPRALEATQSRLVEAPVTTMPVFRLPVHFTYVSYLGQFSTSAAAAYQRAALAACRLRGVGPSMLLHPLDFLGPEDEPDLAFFPGMKLAWPAKRRLLDSLVDGLRKSWQVGPVAEHAAEASPVRSGAAPQPAAQP
ncbi:MAG: polysaccharide deacetylase family protein [Planctomycetota bacterium]